MADSSRADQGGPGTGAAAPSTPEHARSKGPGDGGERKRRRTQVAGNHSKGKGEEGEEEEEAVHPALAYLRLWKADREQWKFSKLRQTWLVRNVYDPVKIQKRDFKILAKYLEGLKGNLRQQQLEAARGIVEGESEAPTLGVGAGSGDEDENTTETEQLRVLHEIRKYRARKLLHALG